MKVHVAQIGARRHYAVPVALQRAGALAAISTDWCANRGLGRFVADVVPRSLLRGPLTRIHDRRIPHISAEQVSTFFGHSLRMSFRRRNGRHGDSYAYWAHANQDFGQRVVRRGFGDADTVYGFNAASVEIFRAARRQGLWTVLDQTMAPWRYVEQLLSDERERWPEWEEHPSGDEWQLLADREAEEWELADAVICGSPFVVDAIQETGGDARRCRVVPYGYDALRASHAARPGTGRPLRVLFVGTLELRKGVPYLLEAVRQLGPKSIDVSLVGPIRIRSQAVDSLRQHVEVCGPIPRSDVQQHYRWADVFVLPTLAEGSANVCYEAMSHGLPVITTPNAGSVVRDEVDGYVIPPRDADALADRIHRLADDPELLKTLADSALSRSAEFSWTRYYQQLPANIREALAATSQYCAPVIPACEAL